jgi:hypothetical protein
MKHTYDIPQDIKDSLSRYVQHKIQPGGFLIAVLANDLSESIGRADDRDITILPEIAAYIYNELPIGCWGSYDAVEKWLGVE